MTGSTPATVPPTVGAVTTDRRLRVRAIPLLVLLIVEAYVGGRLATPYNRAVLATHIGLAVVLVAFAAHAFVISVRLPKPSARGAAGLTFVSTLAAALSGTVFLLGGSNPIALDSMEGFAVVAILGAILLIALGAVKIPRPAG